MTQTTTESELYQHAMLVSRLAKLVDSALMHHLFCRDDDVFKTISEMRTVITEFREIRK